MNVIKSRRRKTRNFSNRGTSSGFKRRGKKGKNKGSAIDPRQLIKEAVITEQTKFTPAQSFDQMPVNFKLKANLKTKGYILPTQIQQETLEPLLAGRDLVGVAETGTGKTGAFLIPIIEKLLNDPHQNNSLIVVPTRELALQIEEEFKSLTRGLRLFSATFIGGTSVGRDLSRLRKPNQVIIGTPGRLMDLANRGSLRLEDISILVLDEFDRMLDMGFINDIKKLIKSMRRRQQTMLFSATIDKTQKSLIANILRNPLEVKTSTGDTSSSNVDQDVIHVGQEQDKFSLLLNLLDDDSFEKVLIFAETKRLVDKVSKRLNKSGVSTELIHGNKTQNYRCKALNKFKKGQVQVLVATDVAARGIDVTDITHVINYQLPLSYESYIHRIGRTGRAGKIGKAYTFVDAA